MFKNNNSNGNVGLIAKDTNVLKKTTQKWHMLHNWSHNAKQHATNELHVYTTLLAAPRVKSEISLLVVSSEKMATKP